MSERDIAGLVEYLAENPEAGDVIAGTGGCRKVRFQIEGNNKGKSGGVRTITLFSGEDMPVFLITVFGKSQKVSLSMSEKNQLKTLADRITTEYSTKASGFPWSDRMSKQVFEQIAAGLDEALAVARGEAEPYRLHVPAEIDVKAIRTALHMTQRDFASTFGFGIDQVKQWEQGRSRPLDGSRAYLLLIRQHPEQIAAMLEQVRAEAAVSERLAMNG